MVCEINVTTPAELEIGDGVNSEIEVEMGDEDKSIPQPVLTVDGEVMTNVTYVYEVVDEFGEPFAEGQAPITVDENGNITPVNPGTAKVIVSLSEESAKLYDADPVEYTVTVEDSQVTLVDAISADGADNAKYFTLDGVEVHNPAPGIYIRVRGNKVDKVRIK